MNDKNYMILISLYTSSYNFKKIIDIKNSLYTSINN